MPRERHAVPGRRPCRYRRRPFGAGVSIAYGTVVAADSRTVDVRIGGSVVAGICMTTSCRGAAPGQRAILIGSPPLWTAIGIIA